MARASRADHMVAVEKVAVGQDNVRVELGDLQGLVHSIRRFGILQPLVVVPQDDGTYLLAAGHRRLAAAKEAGLGAIPVVERDLSADDRVDVMVTENLLRRNLSHIEEAKAHQRLMERDGVTQKEVAKRLGISPTTVNTKLRFLKLPPEIQKPVIEGKQSLVSAVADNPVYDVAHRKNRQSWADRVQRIRETPNRVYVVVAFDSTRAPADVQVFAQPERAFNVRDELSGAKEVKVFPCDVDQEDTNGFNPKLAKLMSEEA